jgi:hypothetical protein
VDIQDIGNNESLHFWQMDVDFIDSRPLRAGAIFGQPYPLWQRFDKGPNKSSTQ